MSAEQQQPSQDDPAFGDTVFGNLFRTFIEPDLKARVESVALPNPFPLSALKGVQIVFFPDGKKPCVRINDEVRAIAEVRPKDGVVIEEGDPVSFDQIESIGVIGLTDEDADSGHATFIRQPNGDWVGYFDFHFHKGTARRHLDAANQFIHAAQSCRDQGFWVAFADTLFSAAELSAKASLYCLEFTSDITRTRKHQTVKANFNKQGHIGNIDSAHTTAFNRLWELRQKGRYIEEDITFDEGDANQLLQDVRSLIDAARRRADPFGR